MIEANGRHAADDDVLVSSVEPGEDSLTLNPKHRQGAVIGLGLTVVSTMVAVLVLLFGDSLLVPGQPKGSTITSQPPPMPAPSIANQPSDDPVATPATSPSAQLTTTKPRREPVPSDMPEDAVGNWSGLQVQTFPVQSQYPIQVRFGPGRIGQQVGISVFPTLGCTFNLFLHAADSSTLDVEARVASGPCIPAGLRISVDGDELPYDLYVNGSVAGNGTLGRVS